MSTRFRLKLRDGAPTNDRTCRDPRVHPLIRVMHVIFRPCRDECVGPFASDYSCADLRALGASRAVETQPQTASTKRSIDRANRNKRLPVSTSSVAHQRGMAARASRATVPTTPCAVVGEVEGAGTHVHCRHAGTGSDIRTAAVGAYRSTQPQVALELVDQSQPP